MDNFKHLPQRRYTKSREKFWQGLFNDYSQKNEDHSISGWSATGLKHRLLTYQSVLADLHLVDGAKVLDLGCGSGVYSRLHAESGSKVIGMDYAVKVVIKAKQRTESVQVNYLSGDAYHIPFIDRSFDHVVCIGLFQSLDEHQPVINEIYRVLKANAPFCLMTLNRRELSAIFKRIFNREEIIIVDKEAKPRLNTYDPQHLLQDVLRAGFVRTKVAPVQVLPGILSGLQWLLPVWNIMSFFPYFTARSFVITGRRPQI